MGTETSNKCIRYTVYTRDLVKLNNPLMGTETRIYSVLAILISVKGVKLNNPLMGTETWNTNHSMLKAVNLLN